MTWQPGTACENDPDIVNCSSACKHWLTSLYILRLDSYGDIKVGDFGLAEDVYVSGYFRQKERADVKLPFKWMAIESLNDAIFTEKTDVVCVRVCVL